MGLAHNFAGSSTSLEPKSVMDYPPPIISIDHSTGRLVLNNLSYMSGIGSFDKISVDFAYRQFSEQERSDAQRKTIQKAAEFASNIQLPPELSDYLLAKGRLESAEAAGQYVFLTDEDIGGGDWRDSQWDSGTDPIAALNNSLLVRGMALENLPNSVLFSPHFTELSVLLTMNPTSNMLSDIFPIVWLWHRYEVEAVAKLIGGYSFTYTTAGDEPIRRTKSLVPETRQFEALNALLGALDRRVLTVGHQIAQLLSPIVFGFEINPIGGVGDTILGRISPREFDIVAVIEVASSLVRSHSTTMVAINYEKFTTSNFSILFR